ncbi:MAG: hypothetical protein U0795_15855 [Pirellulales bacterium]
MQLDELQQKWQLLDQKLDSSLQLQSALMRHVAIEAARRKVRWTLVRPAIDMVWCVAVVAFAAYFAYRNWPDASLVLPAGLLMIGAIVTLVDYALEMSLAAQIDWHGSVADIQSLLGQIRILRLRRLKWLLLLSPILGFCSLVVAAHWATRVNVVEQFDRRWVVTNIVFGLVCIPIGWMLIRAASHRWGNQSWWQRVVDDLSGGNLRSARQELDRWSELQKELG